jgi:hypothetical protein
MKLFRVLIAFDALALLVLLYFFADGLRYSSGGDYVGTWLPILLVPIAVLGGAWALHRNGKHRAANVLLGVLAAPFVIYLLFVGLFVVLDPDMR